MSTTFTRKQFLTVAGAGLGTLALGACAGPSTDGGGPDTKAVAVDWSTIKPASSISYMSSHPGKSRDTELLLIESFQKENPGITVNLVTGGANYEEVAQKFQTSQAGNDVPDVLLASDVWWFRYALSGAILPLNELLKATNTDISGYVPGLVSDYEYDQKQWAIPYARSTPLFYFNKDHFKAAGVPEGAPATWEEFAEWAPKIKAANASASGYQNAYQYPAIAGYAGWTLQNLLWGRGGAWSKEWEITADSEESVAAMQWVQDSIIKDSWAGVSSKNALTDLQAGAFSATISSSADLATVMKASKESAMRIGVGVLPGGDVSKSPVSPTGGSGLVIASKSTPERQLAAAMFIAHVTNAGNTAKLSAATGYAPVTQTADVSAILAQTPEFQVVVDQLKQTRNQDYARTFLPGGDQELAKAATKIMNEKADVKTTMSELKASLESIYNKDVKPKLKS
ncbi:ABC transporter substrate-binding protein [[Arthrobacter] sp. ATCC 21022]|uniref:ABC transporter substrate-binding protein n=1 Tax=[Arthrobacter] sp. ATCC 21022 TaxID=1771959 RepID=UPI00074D3CB0|nr:carbohydrate-binding protein [Arthrobacter sp. ATCC 21022]KUR63774.1 carbohydrate-binding protein [Arthrobacter sp. ATCC 21022]